MHKTPAYRRQDAVPVALPVAVLLLGTLSVATPVVAAEVNQKTAVVLEPKVTGPIIPQDLAIIEKSVQTALQEQQFQIVSKGERDSIVSAGNLKNCYRNDCLEQLGRLLSANLVLAYKVKVDIVELPVAAPAPAPSPRANRRGAADQPEPSPAGSTPLNWQVNVALYNIEVGAIGARLEMKCEHCSGPQVAQNTADLFKRAVLEDASKVREQLEILSEPGNSSVLVDGVELGVTPYKRPTFIGKHEITVRHTGYKSTNQEIAVSENKKTSLSFQLEAGQDKIQYIQEYQPRPKWRLGLGGALIGVGLAGIGVGAYGLAINGQCIDAPVPPKEVCDMVRNGQPAGLGFLIGGGVVAVAGAVIMLVPGKRNPLTQDSAPDTFGDKDSKAGDKPAAKPAPRASLSMGGLGSGLGIQLLSTY